MKKQISPIIAFSIIILIAGIVGIAIFLFSQEIKDDFILNEEMIEKLAQEKIINESEEGDLELEKIIDWETYRNEEYGFEFKYPKEWGENSKLIHPISLKILKYDDLSTEQEENGEWQFILKSDLIERKQLLENNQAENIIKLDNKKARFYTGYWPPSGNFYQQVEFFINNDLIEITVILPIPYDKKNDVDLIINQIKNKQVGKNTLEVIETFNQMLSTFRFQEPLLEKIIENEFANWQSYNGEYPINFSYPKNLKLSQGDADYFSVIRLWNPLSVDRDTEFSIKMPYQWSSNQTIQKLQERGFVIEKEIYIDNFLATQLKGMDTPNSSISPSMTTKVVVQVGNQVYEISNWRTIEDKVLFEAILNSINF